jgi:hypothetical protein
VQVPLDASVGWHFVSDIAFSPDSKILAVVGRDHASILLLDLTPAQSGDLFGVATVTPTLTQPTEAVALPSATPSPCEGAEVVMQAGVKDDFDLSNGLEPAQPGDILEAMVRDDYSDPLLGFAEAGPALRNFDQAEAGRWFAHRFPDLRSPEQASPICAATLELRVKPGKESDGIALIFAEDMGEGRLSYAFGWWMYWGRGRASPGLFESPWIEGKPAQTTLLDLSALPTADGGRVNILEMLNEFGYVDVVIRGDTVVDYITLRVRYVGSVLTITTSPTGPP